ncbi:MAG: tyrosine-type recombinase/integrase [Bdellovibrionales bacterium]|nr:tyrosine-type recombinase/integrase [Bdellovibrionales bacterium]
MMANRTKPSVEKLIRGYLGFCEGRGKAALTISSYGSDLHQFKNWLEERGLDFYSLRAKDFDLYLSDLRKEGKRVNTQRRKLLSARALYRYAFTRKKLDLHPALHVKAPERKERLPWIPNRDEVNRLISRCGGEGALAVRSRLIVRVLCETGMNVSELCSLEWRDCQGDQLTVQGKRKRVLRISQELRDLLAAWRMLHSGKHLFPGFNRFGPTSLRLTNRGVEVLFRRLSTGLPRLHPKALRHHAVMAWLVEGVADTEIRRRLGVNPLWSLDLYRRALERTV